MDIFWSDIRQADSADTIHPGRSGSPGSSWAWSLLSYAVKKIWERDIPDVSLSPGGKPFFPDRPDISFSLSHTRGFVFVAVSDQPVGADVEYRREIRSSLEERLLQIPHGDLDVFELWALRESWYKLTGEGDLRDIPFSRRGGVILGPRNDLKCQLYDAIPNCSAAVCSLSETPSNKLLQVPWTRLIRHND